MINIVFKASMILLGGFIVILVRFVISEWKFRKELTALDSGR